MDVRTPPHRQRWALTGSVSSSRVAATLGAAALLVLTQLYCTIPQVPDLATDLRVAPSTATWATTAFGLAFAVGTLLFAGLSDAVGRVPVLRWGLIALVPATLLVAVAPSWPWLLAARCLQGLLAATVPPVALAYVGDQLPVNHRAGCLAVVGGSFLLAAIAGQDYGAIAGALVSWRAAFLITVPLLVIAQLAISALPERRESTGSTRGAMSGTIELLGCRGLARPCVAALVLLGSFTTVSTALAKEAAPRYGLDATGLALVRSASIVSLAFAPLIITRTRHLAPPGTGAVALLVAAAGALLLTASGEVVALTVGHALLLGGIAVAVPCVVAVVAAAGATRPGAAIALYSSAVFLGASAGPVIADALEPFGLPALGIVVAAWLAVSACALALNFRAPPGTQQRAHAACTPPPKQRSARSSSLGWARETRPTARPSRPKRLAMASPRFGPAPTMTIDMDRG